MVGQEEHLRVGGSFATPTPRQTTPTGILDDAIISELLLDWDDAAMPSLVDQDTDDEPFILPSLFDTTSSASIETAERRERVDTHTNPRSMRPQDAVVSRSTLCRQRQREELHRLRAEVIHLESQLQHVQRSGQRTPRTRDVTVRTTTLYRSVWQRIATHQLERKRHAERENTKLRGLIREHHRVAKRLEKVLQQTRSLDSASHQVVGSIQRSAQDARENQVPPNCERLVNHHTQTSYNWQHVARQVFQNDVFWMEDLDRELVRIHDRAANATPNDQNIILESAFSKVFPFDVGTTGATLWRNYSSEFGPILHGQYTATKASDSLLVARYELEFNGIRDSPIIVKSHFAVRLLHAQPDRFVILWEDLSSSSSLSSSSPTSQNSSQDDPTLQVQISGCVCLETFPCSPCGPGTIMRVYSLQNVVNRPGKPTAQAIPDHHVRRACDKLADVCHDVNRRVCEALETALLDDALGQA